MHYTSGATALSSINFWQTSAAQGASAHFVIDRDGTLYQCRPCDVTCGHAGKSRWTHKGITHVGLNSCSIGIEFANAGDNKKLIDRWSKLAPILATHKSNPTVKPRQWEAYTPEQIATGQRLSRVLCQRYNLDAILGHEDIAPERKTDPGPAFPMRQFRDYCGL
jgi:N-acetylmuramoyl-L-alanine amidase